jgi:hypothetical protein
VHVARIGEKTNVELWWINLKERDTWMTCEGDRRLSKRILNRAQRCGLDSFKNTVKWRAVVNKVMNRRVPYNKEVSASQERFCSVEFVGCTALNVELGNRTAVWTKAVIK